MNHWFLVGRDLMWVVLGMSPVVCGMLAVNFAIVQDEFGSSIFASAAVILQGLCIALLYFGRIQ